MNFTKMHGLGNDFIVIKGPLDIIPAEIARICNRHTGIGADGFLLVSAKGPGRIEMKYWNADGSIAEMCGNGLRCAIRYAVDNKLVQAGKILAETGAGPLKAVWDGQNPEQIEVQVGKVVVDPEPVKLHGSDFYIATVGNPHAVSFVESVESAPVALLGPSIETDPHFPNKTNVEFVEVQSPSSLKMRVWERGVGETLACGTGMVACAAIATQFKDAETSVTITVPGGQATVWVDKEGFSRIKGPAVTVYRGILATGESRQ